VCAFLKLYNVSEIDLKPIQIEVTNNTNMPSLCKYIVKESKIPSSNPHPLFPHPHTHTHTQTHKTNMRSLYKYIVKESKIPSSNTHPLSPHPHTHTHRQTHTHTHSHML